ncbi:MAG: phosphoribosyltransferase family protein [Saprospiraceae bacterium]
MRIKSYLDALIDVFFPVLCIACDSRCDESKELFCFKCQNLQSPTSLHLRKENEFTDHFIGRLKLHTAAALYYYTPGGIVHQLLEQIKYRSKPHIADKIGKYYGNMLTESPWFHDIDLILPVPLHPKKQAKRGYNQCEVFGKSIAEALSKEFQNNILIKLHDSTSQTEMGRLERTRNMNNTFALSSKEKLFNKNILLIDDVMTTGATLEACANEILKARPQSISFLTIAIGK